MAQRLTSFAALAKTLDLLSGPGFRGTAAVERLLSKYEPEDDRAGSKLARSTLAALRKAGLPRPTQECVVELPNRTAYVDIAFPQIKHAIEVDGREWHTKLTSFANGRARQDDLLLEGWNTTHVTHANFAADIERAVKLFGSLSRQGAGRTG